MPRKHLATKLPPKILAELDSRLAANDHSEFCSLSLWLKGLGYNISKSAIFNYSKALRQNSRAADVTIGSADCVDLRMRCADAAAKFCGHNPGGATTLIPLASELYQWVTQGDQPAT